MADTGGREYLDEIPEGLSPSVSFLAKSGRLWTGWVRIPAKALPICVTQGAVYIVNAVLPNS